MLLNKCWNEEPNLPGLITHVSLLQDENQV